MSTPNSSPTSISSSYSAASSGSSSTSGSSSSLYVSALSSVSASSSPYSHTSSVVASNSSSFPTLMGTVSSTESVSSHQEASLSSSVTISSSSVALTSKQTSSQNSAFANKTVSIPSPSTSIFTDTVGKTITKVITYCPETDNQGNVGTRTSSYTIDASNANLDATGSLVVSRETTTKSRRQDASEAITGKSHSLTSSISVVELHSSAVISQYAGSAANLSCLSRIGALATLLALLLLS